MKFFRMARESIKKINFMLIINKLKSKMENQLPLDLNLKKSNRKMSLDTSLRMLVFTLIILIMRVQMSFAATCPSSVPSSAAIQTELSGFSGYSYSMTYNAIGGPVSNDVYYLYAMYKASIEWAVRRVDQTGSEVWAASLALTPVKRGLSVDDTEQNVYFSILASPIIVIRLSASSGALVSQHTL